MIPPAAHHRPDRVPPRQGLGAAAVALAALYASALVAANLLTSHYGLIAVGFGLYASAGTYAAGLALALRDSLQSVAGMRVVLPAMALGLLASAVTADPQVALASTVATALAETTDFAVYTPLRRRRRRTALAVSCAVGAVVDTVVFLSLAGFPVTLATVAGQVLAKAMWVVGAYLIVCEGARRVVSRQRQLARGA